MRDAVSPVRWAFVIVWFRVDGNLTDERPIIADLAAKDEGNRACHDVERRARRDRRKLCELCGLGVPRRTDYSRESSAWRCSSSRNARSFAKRCTAARIDPL